MGTLFYRFVKKRRPDVVEVSKPMDVSSNPNGCCCVTTRVLTISNSHAGTHADTPLHFLEPEVATPYTEDQYTGDALLLDLSVLLQEAWDQKQAAAAKNVAEKHSNSLESTPTTADGASSTNTSGGGGGAKESASLPGADNKFAITAAVLKEAEDRYGIDLSNTTRLLVCTTNPMLQSKSSNIGADNNTSGSVVEDKWRPEFAHLSVDGAEYLTKQGQHLLLFAIDTPSVDHPSAAPICDTAHGTLWRSQVAILENLDFRNLHQLLASEESNRRVMGSVQTVFNPYQTFADAKGCSVLFYPPPDPTLLQHQGHPGQAVGGSASPLGTGVLSPII